MTQKKLPPILLTFTGVALLLGIAVMVARQWPRSHPPDYLTLHNGQITVRDLVWPSESSRWRGHFVLTSSPAAGDSRVVVRLKNDAAFSWQMQPLHGGKPLRFAPGEEQEIFQGSVPDLGQCVIKLLADDPGNSDVHVRLSVDTVLPSEKPANFTIQWDYL